MDKEVKRLTNRGQRYSIILGSMGCMDDPAWYPTHFYSIASGKSFYASITSALEENYLPYDAKQKLIDFLREKGYWQFLSEFGY